MKHLWQINHPYYGPEGYTNHCESFTELREYVDSADEDMNHIYRWDWDDYSQPHNDYLHLDDEERSRQTFTVYAVMPRKSAFISWTCPISHEQEGEVLEWLQGPRILGALRTLWEPLLDVPAGDES